MAIMDVPRIINDDRDGHDHLPPAQEVRTVFVANGHMLSEGDRGLLSDMGIQVVDVPTSYQPGDVISSRQQEFLLAAQKRGNAVAAAAVSHDVRLAA